ncbi:MAG: hypothetical protein JF887_09960 [Candidatus Dormibacteraeota bacterium]|uniref:Glycoside hydrolase family 42 N-terminal domain-containing protein n=1 Tax=Candidatus Amunia macphersoniae TaxID=3127014 RepID=A0A934KEA3_9BACT|nr:hypothetical protein [Candidatus Dormibacteraeota bacterium]
MEQYQYDQLEVGVSYRPAAVGPYLWHEFNADVVTRDLTQIAARRIPVVRLNLSWDAFMPSDRVPNPRRMRDLETLLGTARELGIRVVPTLFAQSIGDCVMLPSYAIDRRAPRQGVRCITDGRVVTGGPRDIYADPLMLEVQVRWLDAMLAAFAHHPAIAAWDLGVDPATTIRPRRTVHMSTWAALLAERVHAQEEQCRLTLGQTDVVRARGVRLAAVAPYVDILGLAMEPQRLPLPSEGLDPGRGIFIAALAQALAGASVPLIVEIGLASGDSAADAEPEGTPDRVTAPSEVTRSSCDQLLQRLAGSGVAGLHAGSWSDWGQRLREAPPADRLPWLARSGLVDATGVSKPVADAWDALTGRDHSVATSSPYPANIDVESYYAGLPDSLLDLYASWQGQSQ